MSCCDKIKSIVKGNVYDMASKLSMLPKEKCVLAESRIRICRCCDKGTWLIITELALWLSINGIRVLSNLKNLTTLPPLEIKPCKKGAMLFCSVCKCRCAAKAFVETEICPGEKW